MTSDKKKADGEEKEEGKPAVVLELILLYKSPPGFARKVYVSETYDEVHQRLASALGSNKDRLMRFPDSGELSVTDEDGDDMRLPKVSIPASNIADIWDPGDGEITDDTDDEDEEDQEDEGDDEPQPGARELQQPAAVQAKAPSRPNMAAQIAAAGMRT